MTARKTCVVAQLFLAAALSLCAAVFAQPPDDLMRDFRNPPDSARPWVYWLWLNGNITREGISADLEAMARVGIGGVLIMEVDQGAERITIRRALWGPAGEQVHGPKDVTGQVQRKVDGG